MPIDSRIAMGLQVPDIAGSIQGGLKFHDQREAAQAERTKQGRLADLLPQAAHGDQTAIDQLWAVDPNIAMRMDERQRQQAQAVTSDLASAVRWADNPQKWQYVQEHYRGQGIDLSPYRFEDRERGLVALGQIGKYLQPTTNPTSMERDYNFLREKDPTLADQFLRNRAEGPPLVANNGDGTYTIIPRGTASPSTQQGEITATGPNGEKLRLNPQTNQWEPIGGPSPGGSGGFP